MTGQRGFTLIEMTVVIAILAIVALFSFSLIAVLSQGDDLNQSVNQVRSVIERGRARSVSRQARFEVLVDFANNTLMPLERQPVAFFPFETLNDSITNPMALGAGAAIDHEYPRRREGGALSLGRDPMSRQRGVVNIAWSPGLDIRKPGDGISVSFDVLVEAGVVYGGLRSGHSLVSKGGEWDIRIAEVGDNGVVFSASAAGVTVISRETPLPPFSWGRIEMVVSPDALRLYVDGVPSVARFNSPPTGSAGNTQVRIGAEPCIPLLMDNLKIERLQGAGDIRFEGTVLVPPGILDLTPASARNELEALLTGGTWGRSSGPGTANAAPPPMDSAPMLGGEGQMPVKKALIYFDESGNLDTQFHSGPVTLMLAARSPDNDIVLRGVKVGLSGALTAITYSLEPRVAQSAPLPASTAGNTDEVPPAPAGEGAAE